MVSKLKVFFSLALVSGLAACGGGGGGGTSPTATYTPVDAKQFYSGVNNKTLLTTASSAEATRQIFGTGELSSSGVTAVSQAGRSLDSQTTLGSAQTSLILSELLTDGGQLPFQVAARALNQTEACDGGGSLNYSGEVNDSDYTGVVTLTANNCRTGGSTVNGSIQMQILAYDTVMQEPTAYNASFQNMTLVYAGETYSLSGTQAYSYSNGVATTTSNMHRNSSLYGQALLENFKIVNNQGSLTITGRIFTNDYGYVDIFTQKPLQFGIYSGLPTVGEVLLSGVSGSKTVLRGSYDSQDRGQLLALLDNDGNDVYESLLVINDTFDWGSLDSNDFATNQVPVVDIVITPDPSTLSPWVGQQLALNGLDSYDPERLQLMEYLWTIESAPTGSGAIISSAQSAVATFQSDIAGDYSISLRVTDALNVSSVKVVDFTVVPVGTP